MQATNPDPEVAETAQVNGGGVTTLKSFGDLKEATTLKQIHTFADQIRKGIDSWRTAGSILVELARTETDIFKKIQAVHPNISTSTLETFMRIGRKEIWPPLLADSSYGARRLLECNYDLQKEYAEKPIDVAIEWSGDKIRSKKVRVSEMSRSEVSIVFDGSGGINNLEQQAFRLPAAFRSSKPMPVVVHDPVKPITYRAPQKVNVDIGYFSLVIQPDGKIICEPCGKSPIAQPVRVDASAGGCKSAIVVYYKQEVK
jgi:hypothetical protein